MSEYLQSLLGSFSVALAAVAYPIYCKDVISGSTKPHAFSWLVWSAIGGIAFFGLRADDAGAGSWLTGFVTITCLLIFLLSLRFGEMTITKFDWSCLLVALLTIPIWIITKTPLWSMILVTLIDSVGFLPTFRKSWTKPFEETVSIYFLSAASNLTSIFAMNNLSLTTLIYPTTLVFMNLAFVVFVLWRRRI